jgi:hypothetical protein
LQINSIIKEVALNIYIKKAGTLRSSCFVKNMLAIIRMVVDQLHLLLPVRQLVLPWVPGLPLCSPPFSLNGFCEFF